MVHCLSLWSVPFAAALPRHCSCQPISPPHAAVVATRSSPHSAVTRPWVCLSEEDAVFMSVPPLPGPLRYAPDIVLLMHRAYFITAADAAQRALRCGRVTVGETP